MTRSVLYDTRTIDLSVAGFDTVDGGFELIAFLGAVDAAGADVATAKVQVKAERNAPLYPLRVGDRALNAETRRFIISWAAQPGVQATFGFSADHTKTDWEPKPTAVLLTGVLGATLTVTAVNVLGVATVLAAANANRKSITFQNNGTADVEIGGPTVAIGAGLVLKPGASYTTDKCTGAYSAITGTPGQDVRVLEEAA